MPQGKLKKLEKWTSLWVTKALRARLYELKQNKESWDEMLTRLLVPRELSSNNGKG